LNTRPGEPITGSAAPFRLFNPCPCDVATPILLELNDLAWPSHAFKLADGQASKILPAVYVPLRTHAAMPPAIPRRADGLGCLVISRGHTLLQSFSYGRR